jgi:hypothetical protein
VVYGNALTGGAASGKSSHGNLRNVDAAGEPNTAAKSARKAHGAAIASGVLLPKLGTARHPEGTMDTATVMATVITALMRRIRSINTTLTPNPTRICIDRASTMYMRRLFCFAIHFALFTSIATAFHSPQRLSGHDTNLVTTSGSFPFVRTLLATCCICDIGR